MNLSRLEELKQKLVKAKVLSDVGIFFFDHFGDDQAFMDLGEPTRSEMIESLLPPIAGAVCRGKAAITRLMLMKVPGTPFIHGGCMVNGRIANVIYFDDIQVGLLMVSPDRNSSETPFSRFSARPIPPEAVPSQN